VLTTPRPKGAIGVYEGPEHLTHERPEIDWFAEHLLVVLRVRNQIGVQVAGYAAGELAVARDQSRGAAIALCLRPDA